MAFHKNLITLSILAVVAPAVFADETTTQQLERLISQAQQLVKTDDDFAVADLVMEQKSLKARATTMWADLAAVLGEY